MKIQYDIMLSRLHVPALVVLLVVGGLALGLAGRNRVWFGKHLPVDRQAAMAARELLDPNTASASSLERLPRLGPARALAIVQYRQEHGPTAYRTASDLQNLRDIGPGTVRTIAPYLALPSGL